jgi:ATP-dependent exoDNAse (exonuclease V) beta subunit (contains helicase and exonuclease domains)
MRELLFGIINYHSRSSLGIALGGRVIGMKHTELVALDDVNILIQCDRLKSVLNTEGFAPFYKEFMQSCWHTNGKSVSERLLKQDDGYEFFRQWQDLADLIIEEEYTQNLLPFGLIAFLDNLQLTEQDDNDHLQSYIDLEKDGVAILTTFVSKGLEFDNVFTLGLIKRSSELNDKLISIPYGDEYCLGAAQHDEDPHFLKHCEETDAEKMRQLYVALTRAKNNLYVPVVIQSDNKNLPVGTASPIELLIGRIKCQSGNYSDLYQSILSENGSTLSNFVSNHSDLMRLTILPNCEIYNGSKLPSETHKLLPPKNVTVPISECVIQSYTSLVTSKPAPQIEMDAEFSPPHDYLAADKNEHSIPSGNEVGILLHAIFEKIDFHKAKEVTFFDIITPYTSQTRFSLWKDVITNIVHKTLITYLPGTSPQFCLADIHPDKIYRETEFLYPCDAALPSFEGVKIRPGFLKGVIDMFFEHNGKYYLVDWKSNWLGDTIEAYTQNNLIEAMVSNRYDVQAAVYESAMKRYLKIIDPRPFNKIFGGTYYIFLRGVGPNTGILHLPPSTASVSSC